MVYQMADTRSVMRRTDGARPMRYNGIDGGPPANAVASAQAGRR
jgi:hypothetical protein